MKLVSFRSYFYDILSLGFSEKQNPRDELSLDINYQGTASEYGRSEAFVMLYLRAHLDY